MALSLGDIVARLGGELLGDAGRLIEGLAPLESASLAQLSFLSNPRYQPQLAASRAGCVIVSPAAREVALARGDAIISPDPYVYFARLTQLWKREVLGARREPGVHASAVIDPGAQVHPSATIGPLCVVERGARIGAETELRSRVSVGEGCSIGERCLLHPGVVIGADGFGIAPHEGAWVKIEQLGAVRIGDDVEVGANTCIDRGALDDTVIEDGVKLDNLIQIGHNVRIGRHTAMAGCVAVAGSTRIGAHCTVGGKSGITGHLTIADHVHISAMSLVSRSITKPGHYTGVFPLDEHASWEKNAATLRQLHGLRGRVRTLEKKKP